MRTICVDLGGSRVKLAAVEDGRIVAGEIFPVAGRAWSETRVELESRIRALKERLAGPWRGLGFASPGVIDERRGVLTSSNAQHAGLEGFDLSAWARRTFDLEIRVLNDARAALIGELNYGCARGERNAVMLILGTGVGTSVVCEGRILRGTHYSAGLLGGFLPVQFDGGRPGCGGEGYLEAYVGTWGLREMTGDPTYDYARLAAEYAAGEARAQRIFATVSAALGAGTLALVHLCDAETVIYSGGVSHFSPLVEAAKAYVMKRAWTPWGKLRFAVAENPEASVTLGLHALFAERAFLG